MIDQEINLPPANFEELYENAVDISSRMAAQNLIIAGPENRAIIEAVDQAYQDGLILPYLVGDKEEILKIAEELNLNLDVIKYLMQLKPALNP